MDDSSVIKVHVDEYETDSDDEEDSKYNDEDLFNPSAVTRSGKRVRSFCAFYVR